MNEDQSVTVEPLFRVMSQNGLFQNLDEDAASQNCYVNIDDNDISILKALILEHLSPKDLCKSLF